MKHLKQFKKKIGHKCVLEANVLNCIGDKALKIYNIQYVPGST